MSAIVTAIRILKGIYVFGILGALGISALIYGFSERSIAQDNAQPQKTSCAQMFQKPVTDTTWVHLTDCRLHVLESAYFSSYSASKIDEALVPVFSTDGAKDKPIRLLLATDEPAVLEPLSKMRDLDIELNSGKNAKALGNTNADPTAVEAKIDTFLKAHAAELFPVRELKGLLHAGSEYTSKHRIQLGGLSADLAPGYQVLEQGAEPGALYPAVVLGIGVVLVLWALAKVVLVIAAIRKSQELDPIVPPPES